MISESNSWKKKSRSFWIRFRTLELRITRENWHAKERLEARKVAEDAVKLAEENADLRKKAEHHDGVRRQTDKTLKILRELLSDARKEKDAALLENQNLKRKRKGSTGPPLPQVKLLTRPRQISCLRATSSTLSCQDGAPLLSTARVYKDPGIEKIDGPMHPPQVPT
jgi:hypothetical protein